MAGLANEQVKKDHQQYTVGWICALSKEQTVATAMLDERHANLEKPPDDHNAYTLGSISSHNVVIACLPEGKIGTSSAATVVTQMLRTFPGIKIGLLVGIGGGVLRNKVRLGDVVVSTPNGEFPGVIQWDSGKVISGAKFQCTGALNNPPSSLLTALTMLKMEHDMSGSKISWYLGEIGEKWLNLAPKYQRSDLLKDDLFKATYAHVSEEDIEEDIENAMNDDVEDEASDEESCKSCDKTQIMKRRERDMRIHYGLIASGNQVIKDAEFRDQLNVDLGGKVLCVEMEAVGLMDNFPCIVIRGICDYADSHKNKIWQEHAVAVAAVFVKELLEILPSSDLAGERDAVKTLEILEKG